LRDTELIAPACHDTASAIAGIPTHAEHWAYISSGTWSLIGALLAAPCNSPAALADDFTNLGAIGNRICFHKAVNGMWLLKQCMDTWAAAGTSFTIEELVRLASLEPEPTALLDVADPELGLVGNMPTRINAQLRMHGHAPLDESPAGAARMAALIFHGLAAAYAGALEELRRHTGHQPTEIVVVGGGCRNDLLCRLTAERTGLPVRRGAPESSTIGNLAVQLAALEGVSPADSNAFAAEVSSWAAALLHSTEPASTTPAPAPICNAANS
jgi:rhamnulokinase